MPESLSSFIAELGIQTALSSLDPGGEISVPKTFLVGGSCGLWVPIFFCSGL